MVPFSKPVTVWRRSKTLLVTSRMYDVLPNGKLLIKRGKVGISVGAVTAEEVERASVRLQRKVPGVS